MKTSERAPRAGVLRRRASHRAARSISALIAPYETSPSMRRNKELDPHSVTVISYIIVEAVNCRIDFSEDL